MAETIQDFIACNPALTPEEEVVLTTEYARTKDIRLRNKIVEHNLRLVFKAASLYHRAGIHFHDLVGEGNLGLIRGVEKYDPTKGVRLGNYVFRWIKAYILRYIVKNAHLVKIGTTQGQRKLFFNLSKTKAKASAQQKELSKQDIADLLGVKVREVEEMEMRLAAPVIRIQAPSSNQDPNNTGASLHKLLKERIDAESDEHLPDALLEKEQFNHRVRKAIGEFMISLDDREQDIFRSRLLTDTKESFKAIGSRWDELSKQRIQQIDAELKMKFKRHLMRSDISL